MGSSTPNGHNGQNGSDDQPRDPVVNGDRNGHQSGHECEHESRIPGGGHDEKDALTIADSIPPHPLGIKPLGNQYIADGPKARDSIGGFRALPDETLMLLLEYLDQKSLRNLGYASRFLYACCQSDDLWKALFLE